MNKFEDINSRDLTYLTKLIKLLDIEETELLKAVISAFSPCQPGALFAIWGKRSGYAQPESTQLIWELFEEADFRCTTPNCRSQHRITLDHADNNPMNSSRENLVVLCHNCNRAKVGKMITKDLSARVVKAIFDCIEEKGCFPNDKEIAAKVGIPPSQLGGTRYFIKMLRKRYQ
jgi:hypothetical protein